MVKVALFVRLEAKPGKEKEVENFSWPAFRSCRPSRPLRRGSESAWGPPPLVSLTPSRTRQAARRILPAKSQRRLWQRLLTCSPNRHLSKKLMCSQQSYPDRNLVRNTSGYRLRVISTAI